MASTSTHHVHYSRTVADTAFMVAGPVVILIRLLHGESGFTFIRVDGHEIIEGSTCSLPVESVYRYLEAFACKQLFGAIGDNIIACSGSLKTHIENNCKSLFNIEIYCHH